ncbi:MAG: sugar phosphate isomerase/epimerase [Oscillospiraceae bacterium]|jgi:sugar phosphate isomerase/epimerase|nr:sugar phosphate isomerase/epimerase [Oscillospiraceae bacterium]
MKKTSLYISTVSEDAADVAARFGLGLEVAEFCTASNMDRDFDVYMPIVAEKMRSADRFTFHAPFNELCPAAIDPLAVELAERRYTQAFALASRLGINKIVVHSGYIPLIYYKSWFTERSVEFWKRLLDGVGSDVVLCLENVMEDEPELLTNIVRSVNDPRFMMCLDVGHAHCESSLPVTEWIDCMKEYIRHVHIHNNRGEKDEHAALFDGTLDMPEALKKLEKDCPAASFAIESLSSGDSVRWLSDSGILED